MSTLAADFAHLPAVWKRRHLLDLESLSADEITCILDAAAAFKAATNDCRTKLGVLSGKTLANLFFENSTRTRNSFSLAAKRLGADTVEFSSSGSSVAKGETFIDTAKNIEAMNVEAMNKQQLAGVVLGTAGLALFGWVLFDASTIVTTLRNLRR